MASDSREEAVKFVREGAVLAQCERFQNAIQYFDEAIKLDPNFATAWFMKGQALIDSGDDNHGLSCIERGLQLDPEMGTAWLTKAVVLDRQGKGTEALPCYDRAAELEPQSQDAWMNKGVALARLGRHVEAINCLKLALDLDPEWSIAWFNKGLSHKEIGQFGDAIDCFARATELNPNDVDTLLHMGDAMKATGRMLQALDCYDRAASAAPDCARAWLKKGSLLAEMGRVDESMACLQRINGLGEQEANSDAPEPAWSQELCDAIHDFFENYDIVGLEEKVKKIVERACTDPQKSRLLLQRVDSCLQDADTGFQQILAAATLAKCGIICEPIVSTLVWALKEVEPSAGKGRVAHFQAIEAMSCIKEEETIVETLKQIARTQSGWGEEDLAICALGSIGSAETRYFVENMAKQGNRYARAALKQWGSGTFREIQTEGQA